MGPCTAATATTYPMNKEDDAGEELVKKETVVVNTPPSKGDEPKDNDDEDSMTVSSMLSEWDEKSASSDDGNEGHDEYEELKQQFASRDALLQRLSRGKNSAYLSSLRYHEELVRAEAFRMLREKQTKEEKNKADTSKDKSTSKTNEQEKQPHDNDPKTHVSSSAPSWLVRTILYESQITLPGLLGLFWYCSFHSAGYEAIQILASEAMRYTNNNEAIMSYGCIVLALVATRLTGGVFEWVNNERHAQAKFDLHNRIRLGYWDARLHLWFRNHSTIKFTIDYIAIYLCLVGTAYIHYALLLPHFEDRSWLIENLPSRAYDFETPISMLLHEDSLIVPAEACDGIVGDAHQQCSLEIEMARQDELYLTSATSMLSVQDLVGFGASIMASPGCYLGTHILITCGSVWVLGRLGFRWN